MMVDFLNENWWVSIILYVLLFVSDHYMTVVSAKLHKTYSSQFFSFQNGYEMNPIFEKEVANFQWFTRKHITSLLLVVLALFYIRLSENIMLFEFSIGALLLPWCFINLGHITNILYFQDIRKPGSLTGQIESSYWLSQRQIAFRSISAAIFLSISALATMRLFFLGGVIALFFQGIRHFNLANRNLTTGTIVENESKD